MASKPTSRFGVAELYGHDFSELPTALIRELAAAQFGSQPCPFKGGQCIKKGGVCSLRLYERRNEIVAATGQLVTTCPQRFLDGGSVIAWVGETLIGTSEPRVITELPFLMGTAAIGSDEAPDSVGKIDIVLINAEQDVLRWCCLEMQAVYFSGPGMESDFKVMREWQGPGVPFPTKLRRPDFRSSGPKRLMPQLQIKVPTISRWGKKMAVVVDLAFWNSLGSMTEVPHVSNCDIAWFVVTYKKRGERFQLQRHALHLTTLDRAVEGLTGGTPLSLEAFEERIKLKLSKLP
jgi:restriction endonuclease NotI